MKRLGIALFVLAASVSFLTLILGIVSAGHSGDQVASESAANIVYAKPGASGDCLSWATACELQKALRQAGGVVELWVSQGIYRPVAPVAKAMVDFTFVAWISMPVSSTTGTWQRIFDFGDGLYGASSGRYMFLTPQAAGTNKPRFAITDAGFQNEIKLDATQVFTPLQWVHVALTLQGMTGTLYIDGQVDAVQGSITLDPRDVIGDSSWLGKSQYPADPEFDGRLDEVAIFDRALSEAEIQAIIASGWEGVAGQVMALHMDDDPASDGTSLVDSSPWATNATLHTDNGTNNKSSAGKVGKAILLDGVDDYVGLVTSIDRNAAFDLPNGVALYGGFTGTETSRDQRDWQANVTVLSGDIDINDQTDAFGVVTDTARISGTNAYHVVGVGSLVVDAPLLDGFTVTGGQALGAYSWPCDQRCGGGIFNDGKLRVANSKLVGNRGQDGGAIFNYGTLDMSNSGIINNTAVGHVPSQGHGGGLMSAGIVTVTSCSFSGNHTGEYGGGIYNYGGMHVSSSDISDNTANYSGGGIYHSGSGVLDLTNSVIIGNRSEYGAGILNYGTLHATNIAVIGNDAVVDEGGGIYNGNGTVHLNNSDISGNAADTGGGIYNRSDGVLHLTNGILWGNSASTAYDGIQNVGIAYHRGSVVQGCGGSGFHWDGICGVDRGGNIDADPLFERDPSPGSDGVWGTEDDDYGNLRLRLTSPAIDAGYNSAVPGGVTADLDGLPRFVDIPTVPDTGVGTPPIVDMGAYEAQLKRVYLPLIMR